MFELKLNEHSFNLKDLQAKMREKLPVYQEVETYNHRYPYFAEETDEQIENNRWTWKEINLEKDKHDFLVRMTKQERYATTFALKLFLKYETMIGGSYWSGRFKQMFKRAEFNRKSSFYAHQEDNVHAPFYNEFNRVMGLTEDSFYESWKNEDCLRDRVQFIGKMINHEFDLYSLAAFTFIEGAVLYNSFGFFKHFQVNGKNLVTNAVAGTDQSVLDENNHAHTSAAAFCIVVKEAFEYGLINEQMYKEIVENIYIIENVIKEHEFLIIRAMFPYGEIKEYTIFMADNFLLERLNECSERMNIKPIYEVKDHTIKSWFKATTSLYTSNDNFHKKSREYKSPGNNLKITSVDVSADILN